ncbi:HDIG domain-containing protein [Verrucomicrobia bacterium S94]|nr:HDIG domain-containing protein [Verrucomicrobia bacterium S94]
MKKRFKDKKKKGIAERKTEVKRKQEIPYKSIGLGLLLWLGITWLFYGQGVVHTPMISLGQEITTPVVAVVDFYCENLNETALNKQSAADAVPGVFILEENTIEEAVQNTDNFFNLLTAYHSANTNRQSAISAELTEVLSGSKTKLQDLISLFPTNSIPVLKEETARGIRNVMSVGVISDESRINLFNNKNGNTLTIVTSISKQTRTAAQQDIYSTRTAVWTVTENLNNAAQRKVLNRVLPYFIDENLHYDRKATETARKAAADLVPPVIQKIPAGKTIARAGEKANEQTLLLLNEHTKQRIAEQDIWEQALEVLGNSIMLLAGLIATAVILRTTHAELIRQPDKVLLLVILSLITLGLARLLTYLSVSYSLFSHSLLMYGVPFGLAVLLAGILLGGSAAITLGFWCSFAAAVLYGEQFNVFALGMIVTITAASCVRNIHKRSSLFRAGIWICAVKVLFVLVSAILNRPDMPVMIKEIITSVISGLIATVMTLLLIPLFEKLFKITTDITLLELSDMGHPLLQKMAIQAPGTYHHSLMVATLAQNAAEAIGANSLLIRVCAYYHDIGKMAKPEFFTENIQHKENPHDELSPHMSALVISSHVKEGLTLAKRHKLPQPILDAIEQHHGNGLISFFYHKAKQAAKEGSGSSMSEVINDSDFRYGGAPAVTPEMAILSLADAAEAAARSIEKPTPQKISNLMDEIFSMKIRDGQLDFANLTIAQINVVKQSFIFSLSNMLHGRIPYPKDDDNNTAKSTDKPSTESGKNSKAG